MPHTVVVVVLPGVITFDLGCVLQIFGPTPAPEQGKTDYELVLCGPSRRTRTGDGFTLSLEHDLTAVLRGDTVLVVGCVHALAGPPPRPVLAALCAAAAGGARIGSVCVGAFALGHAGLLDGRRCTTHWAAAEALADQFPRATVLADALYVTDGPVITSAGAAAGLDLGLYLVRNDYGAEAAAELARWNVVAPHRDGAQGQFIRRPLSNEPGGGTAGVREWALGHLAQPLSVPALAAQARCSERTLARRFLAETGTTPMQWLNSARLLRARELLETTDLSVEHVAMEAGFPSTGALRSRFALALSTTPTAYRRTFTRRP